MLETGTFLRAIFDCGWGEWMRVCGAGLSRYSEYELCFCWVGGGTRPYFGGMLPLSGHDCSELEGSFEELAEIWVSSSELDDQGKCTFLSEKDFSAVLTLWSLSLPRDMPIVESELESLGSAVSLFRCSRPSGNRTEGRRDSEAIVSGDKTNDASSVDIVDASFPDDDVFGETCDFGEIWGDIIGPSPEDEEEEIYPIPDGSLMVWIR